MYYRLHSISETQTQRILLLDSLTITVRSLYGFVGWIATGRKCDKCDSVPPRVCVKSYELVRIYSTKKFRRFELHRDASRNYELSISTQLQIPTTLVRYTLKLSYRSHI